VLAHFFSSSTSSLLLRFDRRLVSPDAECREVYRHRSVADTSIILPLILRYVRLMIFTSPAIWHLRCKRTFISFCTNYFVANCETLITKPQACRCLIEAIGSRLLSWFVIFILSLFVSMALQPIFVYLVCTPFLYPFLRGFSGHSRAPRDNRGTQRIGVFIGRLRFS